MSVKVRLLEANLIRHFSPENVYQLVEYLNDHS